MKKTLSSIVIVVLSTIFALFIAEMAARAYYVLIKKKSKIYQTDDLLGWKLCPNLDTKWRNYNDEIYSIQTNEHGFRSKHDWSAKGKKALIIGDSFAFGQGVDADERFDSSLEDAGYAVINTGVMAYGLDQSYLSVKDDLHKLDSNDVIVILLYYNDIYDVARDYAIGGRSKPYFEIDANDLVLQKPKINLHNKILPHSYLYTKLSSYYYKSAPMSMDDVNRGLIIIEQILRKINNDVGDNQPEILLLYYGLEHGASSWAPEQFEVLRKEIPKFCDIEGIDCIPVGDMISFYKDKEYFLNCGHWSPAGNKLVGN